MSRYCREIEPYIVDYFENSMPQRERERLLNHIETCEDCKKKFVNHKRACMLLQGFKYSRNNVADLDVSELFLRLRDRGRVLRLRLQVIAVGILIAIFLSAGMFFNNYFYHNRLQTAKDVEITIDFVTDIDEIIMYADDETYTSIVASMYGEDYIEFEEILDEVSYFQL